MCNDKSIVNHRESSASAAGGRKENMYNICTSRIYAEYMQNIFRIFAEYMQNICRIYAEYMLNLYAKQNAEIYAEIYAKYMPYMQKCLYCIYMQYMHCRLR